MEYLLRIEGGEWVEYDDLGEINLLTPLLMAGYTVTIVDPGNYPWNRGTNEAALQNAE
jgi:hypothetical protein